MTKTNLLQMTIRLRSGHRQMSKSDGKVIEPNLFAHLPPYQFPTSEVVAWLPLSLVPYAELMRLHKPGSSG